MPESYAFEPERHIQGFSAKRIRELREEDAAVEQTPAQKIAAAVSVDNLKPTYQTVSCDAMSAAAHYVSREYGDYGYSLGIVAGRGYGIFMVRHSDGSEFYIVADRYGNVERIADAL